MPGDGGGRASRRARSGTGATRGDAAAAREAPPEKAPARFPRRMSLDLDPGDHRALNLLRLEAGVPVSSIIRGMIAVCRENEDLQGEAVQRARQERGK